MATTHTAPGGIPAVRKWQHADTVIAFSTALLVIIFAIFGLLVWQGYGTTMAQAGAKAERGAAIVATKISWVVGSGRLILDDLASHIGDDPANLTPTVIADLERATAALPAEVAAAVYRADGTPAGGTPVGGPPDIAQTDYFQALSAGAEWTVAAVYPGDGAPQTSFVIARRLGGAEAFNGAAVITVGAGLLETFWQQQDLGPNSTISVARGDGAVVARYPALNAPVEITNTPPFGDLRGAEKGSYLSPVSPVDGISRVVAFEHLPEFDLIAFASVSRDAAIASLWNAVWTVLYLMVPIGLALLGGSFLTARLLRQSARTNHRLEAALSHNEVLFREIHHRVKNNLQSVAALLQLQPIPREIKEEMGQRIAAMSAVHEHIYRTNSFSTVRVQDYIHTLISNIRAGQDPAVVVVEEIADVAVDKDAAAPLALVLNEVVSNAFKHAFTDGRAGVMKVALVRVDQDTARLTVEDNGVGFDPEAPSKGIGRRLINALTAQLGGESSFSGEAGGSRFVLTFPIVS